MKQYGLVRDIFVYHDDLVGKFFQGNGHVLLESPNTTNPTFSALSHRIHCGGSSFLATWADRPIHCRYCKEMDHSKDNCSNRPQDTRSCYTCGATGHIAIHCPREAPNDAERNQRRRIASPPDPRSNRAIAHPKAAARTLPENNEVTLSSSTNQTISEQTPQNNNTTITNINQIDANNPEFTQS
jgi:hypothetical protein